MIYKVVVYLDLVILSTILVNYCFIKLTSLLIKSQLTIVRLILSLSVSVLSIFLYLVPLKYIYNLRYFIGILIGLIAFKNKEHKLLGVSILYILNLSFIGSLVIFQVNNYLILVLCLFFISSLYILEYVMKRFLKRNIHTYNVVINKVSYRAFLDTGNLVLYKGIPVVFLNKKLNSNIYTLIDRIDINTLNNSEMIDIYKGPKIYINNFEYLVYYAFGEFCFDVLLNNYLEV